MLGAPEGKADVLAGGLSDCEYEGENLCFGRSVGAGLSPGKSEGRECGIWEKEGMYPRVELGGFPSCGESVGAGVAPDGDNEDG